RIQLTVVHPRRYTVLVFMYFDAAGPRAARSREQLWNIARRLYASGSPGKSIDPLASLAVPLAARCSCTCGPSGVAPTVSTKSAKVATPEVGHPPSHEGGGRPLGAVVQMPTGGSPLKFEDLGQLNECIVACRACPRLVDWRERVAREKRAAYRDETYWGRPVPGFGDPEARV